MTAHPIFSESRRKPVSAAVTLVLVLVAVLLAAGCVSQQQPKAFQTPSTIKATKVTLQIPTPLPITLIPLPSATPTECPSEANTNKSVGGKYVFLEHIVNKNHVTISGLCHLSAACYSGPSYHYSFNETNGVLTITGNCNQKEHINDSLMLFYGFEYSDTYNFTYKFCGSGNMGLYVHSLPAQSSDNIILDSVAGDGVVTLLYNDKQIVLKPKERWENITRIIESSPKLGEGEEYLPGCTEEIITTDSIYNAGVFNKNAIIVG